MTPARQPHPSPADTPPDYLPGMGSHHLLALYDPLVRRLGKPALDDQLVRQAGLRSGQRVLDLGCGTGTVTVRAARSAPGAELHGLDPDPRALARARRRSQREGVQVDWRLGYGQDLPYPDGSFDRILCSFMLHHLAPSDRDRTLAEARRVLAPGGSLHLVDFGGGAPDEAAGRRRRFRLHSTRLHSADADTIRADLARAGFGHVEQTGRRALRLLGSAAFYRADAVATTP